MSSKQRTRVIHYKQPTSPLLAFFWRRAMWWKTTFPWTLLEPWEAALLTLVLLAITSLFLTGLYRYFPHTVHTLQRRALFYLYGDHDNSTKEL